MHRKPVETHKFFFFQTLQRGNMIQAGMLCHFEVLHNSSRSNDAVFEMFDTKTFERFGTEMFQQLLACILLCKHPVVEFEHTYLCSEVAIKVLLAGLIEKNFLR